MTNSILEWSAPVNLLGNLKLKVYRDSNGQPKGDGKCCYLKASPIHIHIHIHIHIPIPNPTSSNVWLHQRIGPTLIDPNPTIMLECSPLQQLASLGV